MNARALHSTIRGPLGVGSPGGGGRFGGGPAARAMVGSPALAPALAPAMALALAPACNSLVVAWPELARLAVKESAPSKLTEPQMELQ